MGGTDTAVLVSLFPLPLSTLWHYDRPNNSKKLGFPVYGCEVVLTRGVGAFREDRCNLICPNKMIFPVDKIIGPFEVLNVIPL